MKKLVVLALVVLAFGVMAFGQNGRTIWQPPTWAMVNPFLPLPDMSWRGPYIPPYKGEKIAGPVCVIPDYGMPLIMLRFIVIPR